MPTPNATSITFRAARAKRTSDTRWRTVSGLAQRTLRLFSEMFRSFSHRSTESEIMDDLSRPDREFSEAYRELEIINRRLGGIRAIERFLPHDANLTMLDVGAGACDLSDALLQKRARQIVAL